MASTAPLTHPQTASDSGVERTDVVGMQVDGNNGARKGNGVHKSNGDVSHTASEGRRRKRMTKKRPLEGDKRSFEPYS